MLEHPQLFDSGAGPAAGLSLHLWVNAFEGMNLPPCFSAAERYPWFVKRCPAPSLVRSDIARLCSHPELPETVAQGTGPEEGLSWGQWDVGTDGWVAIQWDFVACLLTIYIFTCL